jgi:hypothetical protein
MKTKTLEYFTAAEVCTAAGFELETALERLSESSVTFGDDTIVLISAKRFCAVAGFDIPAGVPPAAAVLL